MEEVTNLNGTNTIKEFRALVEKGKIDPEEAVMILIGAHADLLENQHSLGELVEKSDALGQEREERIISKIEESQEKILQSRKEDLDKINTKIDKLEETVKKNPMVRVGKFIKEKPKHASWIAFGLIAFSNVWFIDSFRRAVLLLLVPLGFPKEWVDALTTG